MDPEIRDRRERLARRMAAEELPGLLEFAGKPELDPGEVEDGLCARLGEIMHRCDADGGSDPARSRYIEPDRVLGSLTTALIDVLGAPGEVPQAADFEPGGGLFAAWRLWTVLREITPQAEAGTLYALEATLRTRLAAQLPENTGRSVVPDSLRWASDGYRSRFLITVAFEESGRQRWYSWDVDACGYEPVTVAAGFFVSPGSAFAEWRTAVGGEATAAAQLAPVEDRAQRSLIAALLPDVEGFGRMGGESVAQMTEYHRSRRLAQSVRGTPEFTDAGPKTDARLGGESNRKRAEQFANWLAEHQPERVFAFDTAELAAELADTWAGDQPEELFLTCSPHRVAAKTQSIRGYYLEDFNAELQSLFPEWARWIAEQTGLPDHLLNRSLEYCNGQAHPPLCQSEVSRPVFPG
jgi:hypothetical protein